LTANSQYELVLIDAGVVMGAGQLPIGASGCGFCPVGTAYSYGFPYHSAWFPLLTVWQFPALASGSDALVSRGNRRR